MPVSADNQVYPSRKLILIRHSESQPDVHEPPVQWDLTARGVARCQSLAALLEPYGLERLYASYERKAQETARLVAERLGIPYATLQNVHEHDRAGEPFQTREAFIATIRRFFDETHTLVFGQETAHEALLRFSKAVNSLVAIHDGAPIAIVSHGTVISLFVGAHTHYDPYEFWKRLEQPAFVVFNVYPSLSLARTAFTV